MEFATHSVGVCTLLGRDDDEQNLDGLERVEFLAKMGFGGI